MNFASDVQPILRRHCFRCHGTKNQEAGLQLNLRDTAYGDGDSDEKIIVPHQSRSSLLIKRLVDEDLGDIMPLDGDAISQSEIETLRQWIDQGANWPDEFADAKHWAFQQVREVMPPSIDSIEQKDIVLTPIDQFIRQRLIQKGLRPSPPLDRPRLIRRVSLALNGVPPTPQQVQDFVNDPSPDAYEKVVDRLLRSQRYGERWAVPWLDLARYADSNGFQADQIRDNWAYRDWVIRSFNDDLPFNEFVIDQIAGDLRPDATVDQKIATGFHRMTTCNVEAGVHPEANRTNQIVDRVNTTATVFMGATMECAQCHDHKYDPFTQKDYYRLFAYFNNTPLEVENTSGVTWDFVGPKMDLPMNESLRSRRDELLHQIAELESQRAELAGATEDDFQNWLRTLRRSMKTDPQWQPVTPSAFQSSADEAYQILDDASVLLTGSVPDTVEHTFTFDRADFTSPAPLTAIRIELLTDERVPGKGPGRGDAKRSNVILSELTCEWARDERTTPIDLQDANADFSQSGWNVTKAIDGDRKTGWAISPQFGKPHWASFVFSKPLKFDDADQQLVVTLGQFFGRGRTAAKPRVSFFSGDPVLQSLSDNLRKLLAKTKLNDKQLGSLRAEFENQNPRSKDLRIQIDKARAALKSLSPDTTLVMVEMDAPRKTFVMIRGEYENLGDRVSPGVPAIFNQVPSRTDGGSRMDLAKWLTSNDNPLLARVTVNRWWAEFFGTGLVSTSEDFGTQAESPSHPDLLEYLANKLVSNWSMKAIHKQIVMSATFQQSSRLTTELAQLDPDNRLLARGPRLRL
ncbi:MAG: PSD1 and planctomycete cytochrome C domain-containing protein, partial [Pirellulaceae bacterium]